MPSDQQVPHAIACSALVPHWVCFEQSSDMPNGFGEQCVFNEQHHMYESTQVLSR